MSGDGREETLTEDNFVAITAVLVALIVIATIVIVFCILRRTPTAELEVQEGQPQITVGRRLVEYIGRYFNVGDSDAPVWDSSRPRSPTSEYGYIRSTQDAHREADQAEYYTLTIDQGRSS